MTQNDNADFISQLELMSEQMEHEFHGMGRAINKVNDWTQRANAARLALESMEMQKAELMGIVTRVCAPPQLPNYNQIPERGQEIEFDEFDPPNLWKPKPAKGVAFDPLEDVEVPRRLQSVVDVLVKAKREQAA